MKLALPVMESKTHFESETQARYANKYFGQYWSGAMMS
jgi:hypothetical protein